MNKTFALKYAIKKHKGQYRKGSNAEYITHPIGVCNYVNFYLKNLDNYELLEIVALLHDVVEDTNTSIDEIKKIFGDDVANLVYELTNDSIQKEKLGKVNYLGLKMSLMSDDALCVKLCDRLYNVRDTVNADENFRKTYLNETSEILETLLLSRKLNENEQIILDDIIHSINNILSDDNYHKINLKKNA